MTLYLKYRPRNLDEIDETSVAESLKKIVSQKSIPHAFLFAGPKGTGKTSTARILAKIVNCDELKNGKPCDKCKQCTSITNGSNLDVVEMDAASHRGIDDVRILRDAVKLAPVSARKKIYIIDEVHMLTTEASNALLKTLEEPPEHVIFVLATTNPEKLIETIRSRTTLIPFKKATGPEIVRSLKRVAEGEKIKIEDDALQIIAEAADGSFRDAIKVLEQITSEEKDLSKDSLEEFLFQNKSYDLNNFVNLLAERKLEELLAEVDDLNSKGVVVESFLEALVKKIRLELLSKIGAGGNPMTGFTKGELIELIDLFSGAYKEIGFSPIAELPFELAIISWCEKGENRGNKDKNTGSGNEEGNGETIDKPVSTEEPIKVKVGEDKVLDDVVEAQGQVLAEKGMEVPDDAWKNILALVKPVNASMEALLRAAKPVAYNGRVLTLGVYYKFHKERIEEAKHRKILEEIIAKVLQSPTKVCCVLVEPPPKKVIEEAKVDPILTEAKDQNIVEIAEKIFSN